jgi:16S rRNA C1402 N4-methylase RsmH
MSNFEEILKQVNFDRLANNLLLRIDMKQNQHNINILRNLYKNDFQKILTTLTNVDNARGICDTITKKIEKKIDKSIDYHYDWLDDLTKE